MNINDNYHLPVKGRPRNIVLVINVLLYKKNVIFFSSSIVYNPHIIKQLENVKFNTKNVLFSTVKNSNFATAAEECMVLETYVFSLINIAVHNNNFMTIYHVDTKRFSP